MVHFDSCFHQLHLPCYAALCIREAAKLRCPTCRATATVEEADRKALQQHREEVVADAMTVVLRAMPARRRGGGYPPGLHGTAGEGDMQHLLRVGGGDRLVHTSCFCDVHRRCTLGFFEHLIPRARGNDVRSLTYQVSCPNPAPHAEHQVMDLHTLLQEMCRLRGSVDTAAERAVDARVTAAELHLSKSSTIPTGTVDLSRTAKRKSRGGHRRRLA